MSDIYNRKWITEKAIPIVESYHGNLTLRALHYRLVAVHGMTNSMRHYKRVIGAMTKARWDGLVNFDDFQDHDREVMGETEWRETDVDSAVDRAVDYIEWRLTYYRKNRWENQPKYVEVFIEKKALQGVFESPCNEKGVALCPCKGYPSLTYLHQASERFQEAINSGKKPLILYFGDYDPSGEDIPRSIKENLSQMGVNVEVKRIALMKHQVLEWNLPPAPAKKGDSRTAKWDGLGQVELDAIDPNDLVEMVYDAIDDEFDLELYQDLRVQQASEKKEYIIQMKERINDVFDDMD